MGIVLFFKKRVEKAKEERQNFEKKAVQVYLTRWYQKKDDKDVDIPYFIKAERDIKELEERGLISETYRQLYYMGAI